MRYLMVGSAAVVSALIALVFSVFGNFGNFQNDPDSFVPLFSGKLFTESELLEIEMAFANAELTQYSISNGQVQVPPQKKNDFILALKKTSLFTAENASENGMTGFWVSERERQAAELKTKQNELAAQLRMFRGIESAGVILDIGETKNGFAREKHATASISIRSREGHSVSQEDIQSILRLVTGAVYGLSPANVSIIDTRTNRSWKFNAPEIETSQNAEKDHPEDLTSSTGAETKQELENAAHLEKIVFQTEALPRPELFDAGARGMIISSSPRPARVKDADLLSRPLDLDETTAENADENVAELAGNASEASVPSITVLPSNFVPGRVAFAGSVSDVPSVRQLSVRQVSRAAHAEDPANTNSEIQLTSAEEAQNCVPTENEGAAFAETSPISVPEMQSDGVSSLLSLETPAAAETPEIAKTPDLLQTPAAAALASIPYSEAAKEGSRFSVKSSERKSQELFLLLCVIAALVVSVCLLVIYMTRKGLFTSAMLRERMQMNASETNAECDEEKTAAVTQLHEQTEVSEVPGVYAVSEAETCGSEISLSDPGTHSSKPFPLDPASEETPTDRPLLQTAAAAFPSAEDPSGLPNTNAADPADAASTDSAVPRKGKIADILATLESLKNEPPFFPEDLDGAPETNAETHAGTVPGKEEISLPLLPELEELQTFPPERLALALLEERPQTAAMLLRQFSDANSRAVLEHIPANLRLGIESRMTSCTEPDREILRETASAILEYLEALETENALTPAESLFLQKNAPQSAPKFRPLADALPHSQDTRISDTSEQEMPRNHELFTFSEDPKENEASPLAVIQKSMETAAVSESAVSESAVSESAVSESAVSESAVSESAVSESAVSESAVSESAVSESAVSESAVSESAAIPSEFPSRYTSEPHTELLPFEALKQFSKKDLRVLLAANPQEKTLMALLGAEQRLTDRLLGVLPRSEANRVRKQLKCPGQLRLQDVEDARNSLMLLAQELADAGQLRLPKMAESI